MSISFLFLTCLLILPISQPDQRDLQAIHSMRDRLTHSAALSPAFGDGVKERRSGSTLSEPQHLCWGVEGLTWVAKGEGKGSVQREPRSEGDRIIEEYEREKLAKWKRNIGKRYLVVRTVRPAEFYKSPEDLDRSFTIQKEKEGFLIAEVVQNRSGTMNFYQVIFDSGEMGYLSADGNYLEIKALEGSIIPLSRGQGAKRKEQGFPNVSSVKAVDLVKRHLIKMDPMTGERMSIELRMMEAKARFFPNLKWRYEAREIGHNRVRVIQFSEGEESTPILRTWIVDLSTQAVHPENRAAQTLYR